MATTTPHTGPFGEHVPAPPSFEPTPPPAFPPADEPGAASSAVPVVVSVALLFGLAVAAAFVGRGIIGMLSGLLAGG
ncbi:hypothetical protein [Oerskovia flava]|uniref:hypothetical protein n=1 Tax=Oerskovia flava TaxID=2986422 RepID=UPI002240CC98|nr:hypothetical protein [Oerskovia sp. JB1-3-2]